MDQVKVRYVDIDGVLYEPISVLSQIEIEERINDMQGVFREFKLDFPKEEEIKKQWETNNITFDFKLSTSFSKATIKFILEMNELNLDKIAEELNKDERKYPLEWHYHMKEANNGVYYQIKCLNPNEITHKMYNVKQDPSKMIHQIYQTKILKPEAIAAFNYLMEKEPCEILVFTSSWINDRYDYDLILDLLKYQGIHFPHDLRIEKLNKVDIDCGISIKKDLERRKIKDSYDILDDDISMSYEDFKGHLIQTHNSLTMEDVNTYLGLEREKVLKK